MYCSKLKSYQWQEPHEDKFNTAFQRSEFLAVGGSTWKAIIGHINGKNLTNYQRQLGNQWAAWKIADKSVRYLLISLGGNETDQFESEIYDLSVKLKFQPLFKKRAQTLLSQRYFSIRQDIDNVSHFLHTEFPGVELLYLNIIPRCWWGLYARRLAR